MPTFLPNVSVDVQRQQVIDGVSGYVTIRRGLLVRFSMVRTLMGTGAERMAPSKQATTEEYLVLVGKEVVNGVHQYPDIRMNDRLVGYNPRHLDPEPQWLVRQVENEDGLLLPRLEIHVTDVRSREV